MAGRDLIFTILGIDKASPAFDKVGKAAERAGDRLDKVGNVAIKSMAATTAASVAGGAAIAAAIGGVPLLFAGMAAAALASNQEVSDSFRNLADNVVDDVKDMSQPLADDLVGVANDLGRAWADVGPVMRDALADPALGRGVRELSAGVGDLARNAMPGLLDSVRASEPVMAGFGELLAEAGTGTSDLLTAMARESESAGVVIEGFGDITRTTLGDVGGLLAELSAAAAPHMGQLSQLVEQATGSVLGLASGALPVLSSASGTTLGVLNGVLGVLEPISSQLGTGVGLALAAAGGWRVLSAATGAYTKLDLPGKLSAGGLAAGVFTESLTNSATAGERVATAGSKVGRVLGGLGSALPYVGIGVAALGLAFSAAAKSAEELSQRAQNNAEGLLKGGSAADQTRKHLRELETANADLARQMEAVARESGDDGMVQRMADLDERFKANRGEIAQTAAQYEQMKGKLTGAQLAQVQYNEAVEQHGATSAEAAAAGAAWRAALDVDKAKQDAAAAATQTHTERIVEQQNIKLAAVNAGLAYEASLISLEQAQQALNDATTKHGKDSLEARAASVAYQQQIVAATGAVFEKTKAEQIHRGESEASRLATAAQNVEILRLAAVAGTNAPAALQAMVGSLNATELAALGVQVKTNEAKEAILLLPDGKEVKITGTNAQAKAVIDEINRMQLHAKTLYINTVHSTDQRVAQGYGDSGRARGGPVEAGQTYTVGEEGPERVVFGADATVLPRTQTRALDRAEALGRGGGGAVHHHYHLTIQNAGNHQVDLLTQFERLEQLHL